MGTVAQIAGDRQWLVGLAANFAATFGTYPQAASYAITQSGTPIAPPAAPTLSQVVSGALAATTYFAKVAYVLANGKITTPSAESSLAVLINNVLVITSPTAPPAYVNAVGWIPYVSTTTGTETSQSGTIAFGTNWQEPNTGLIAGSNPQATNLAVPSNTVFTGEVYCAITGGRVDMPTGNPGPELWVCGQQGYNGVATTIVGLSNAESAAATMSAQNGNATVYVARLFQQCVGP